MTHSTFDLDVLRSFVAGIDAGSFARAASQLGRSTSAVSAQLKKLEEQAGVPVLRKAGRGLEPTAAGELILDYARRMLALNDEAAAALSGMTMQGSVRLGLQEDFADHLLTSVLGGFVRTHPRVHVEARVARNAQLLDLLAAGRLDLVLAWDSGQGGPYVRRLATLPMRWIGSEQWAPEDPLPLVAVEPPCLMRAAAIASLDRAGRRWRPAFISPSLGGVWAAVAAELGVTVRTTAGLPSCLRPLDGLPDLPSIDVMLHHASAQPSPLVAHLATIVITALRHSLGTVMDQAEAGDPWRISSIA